jgi:adenylylsulfate kinase
MKRAPGFVLWLTGLSGAGKTTLARRLLDVLAEARPAEILDGDQIRAVLCAELGFSRKDRDTNVGRIAFVARLLARQGVVVLVAAISPYREARAQARAAIEASGCPFIEVFVNASIDCLTRRDPKGLYKRALDGELPNFTGVSDPYEAPEAPDVVVQTDRESIAASAETILQALRARGLLAQLDAAGSEDAHD